MCNSFLTWFLSDGAITEERSRPVRSAAKASVRCTLQWVFGRVFGVFALVLLSLQTATADDLPPPIAQVMKRHGLSPRGLSVYAQVIGAPRPFLSVAADEPRNPASVLKLV